MKISVYVTNIYILILFLIIYHLTNLENLRHLPETWFIVPKFGILIKYNNLCVYVMLVTVSNSDIGCNKC